MATVVAGLAHRNAGGPLFFFPIGPAIFVTGPIAGLANRNAGGSPFFLPIGQKLANCVTTVAIGHGQGYSVYGSPGCAAVCLDVKEEWVLRVH